MGRVFSHDSTLWFRLKCWFKDTVMALPSYIWPKPIQSAELTEEEKKLLEDDDYFLP